MAKKALNFFAIGGKIRTRNFFFSKKIQKKLHIDIININNSIYISNVLLSQRILINNSVDNLLNFRK